LPSSQSVGRLTLAVNSASERGLLGIPLHPDFPANPGVYLYWTSIAPPPTVDPFSHQPWSARTDRRSGRIRRTFSPCRSSGFHRPLRLERSTLTSDRNLIKLDAFQNDGAPTPANQNDAAQPPRGNHNGAVLRFGPDRRLYLIFGDNRRRGQMQNLAQGPTTPPPDDQFGGRRPTGPMSESWTGAVHGLTRHVGRRRHAGACGAVPVPLQSHGQPAENRGR
jgi:hypothetical protein